MEAPRFRPILRIAGCRPHGDEGDQGQAQEETGCKAGICKAETQLAQRPDLPLVAPGQHCPVDPLPSLITADEEGADHTTHGLDLPEPPTAEEVRCRHRSALPGPLHAHSLINQHEDMAVHGGWLGLLFCLLTADAN